MKTYLQKAKHSMRPNRLVFVWSEVAKASKAPSLKGEPNIDADKYKIKDAEGNEVQTENPETPQGRNVIRGQAIMMLRKFPYETDSKDLHDAIAASRKTEVGVKNPDGTIPTEENKKATARELKKVLDKFREDYTEEVDGILRFVTPSQLSEDFVNVTELPKGRNFLRSEAIKWLNAHPQTDDNKTIRTRLVDALTWSKKTETGQHWNEIDPSTKKVRGLPKTKEGKVDKAEVRKAKEDSAQEVKEALEAAKTAYPEQAPESK